eukprot:778715-Prymnesium_polylepis.1
MESGRCVPRNVSFAIANRRTQVSWWHVKKCPARETAIDGQLCTSQRILWFPREPPIAMPLRRPIASASSTAL